MLFKRCPAPVQLAIAFLGGRRLNNGDFVQTFKAKEGKAVFERTLRVNPPEGEPPAIWERMIEQKAWSRRNTPVGRS
jgi:hypothetical protein